MKRYFLHNGLNISGLRGIRFVFGVCMLVLAVGCSKTKTTPEPDVPQPIKLRVGVSTRAPIGGDGQLSFTPSLAGWETALGQVDYGQSAVWGTTTASPVAHDASLTYIELATPHYYNKNRDIYTYIKAWYPQGSVQAGGTVMFDAPLTDGTQDVLYSNAVYGAKFNEIMSPLTFSHPMSQIRIKVVRDPSNTGLKLKKIVLKDGQLPKGINLVDDELIYGAQQEVVIYEATDDGFEITTTSKAVGNRVMTKPYATNVVYMDVTTNKAFHGNVRVDIDEVSNMLPGKAYMLTLTFTQNAIHTQGAIIHWLDGDDGSSELD